jgi:hypothetical protein
MRTAALNPIQPFKGLPMSNGDELPGRAASAAAGAAQVPCPTCAQAVLEPQIEQFVYAIGKLEVRLPTIGIEREFRRCARGEEGRTPSRSERMHSVLRANHYLASKVCYLLSIGGTPAFSLMPAIQSAREELLGALPRMDVPHHWVLVIGKLGPTSRPSDCGGLLVPLVFCDQIFSFSLEEWIQDLQKSLAHETKPEFRETLAVTARDLFTQSVNSLQNVGVNDAHRALNFLLMRHPGVFLAVAERRGRAVLEKVESRVTAGLGTRRQVLVILTFLSLSTGVPERLFCRIDVTEEWPFLADQPDGSPPPFGLMPFVESELVGLQL